MHNLLEEKKINYTKLIEDVVFIPDAPDYNWDRIFAFTQEYFRSIMPLTSGNLDIDYAAINKI